MSFATKCLRCASDMEVGRLFHNEQLYPAEWMIGESQEPASRFRLVGKAEAVEMKAHRSEALQSRTYVDAHRCPHCGSVELFATRKVPLKGA